jgi:micrococcal nuclease
MSVRTAVPALAAVVALAALLALSAATDHARAGRSGEPTVRRVVDGDTIVVALPGGDEQVRLVGIDTPETVKPDSPVECFGPEASARTKALLPPGTTIRLERDVEARDRYGRLLAYVYRQADGVFVNLALATEGYARHLTIAPNNAYADRFAGAAATARRDGRGLWGACPG